LHWGIGWGRKAAVVDAPNAQHLESPALVIPGILTDEAQCLE